MTAALQLQHWWSPADPGTRAVELLPASTEGKSLSIALGRLACESEGAAFLIVRVDQIERAEIHQGINAFQRAAGGVRLCLSGTRSTLESLGSDPFDRDRVGWMLDEIDVTTPWSEIVSDRIEAIRFSSDFVTRARRNMRLGFVLEAMLLLARDLGLCALGSPDVPGGGATTGRMEFDYIPLPFPRSTLPAVARHGTLRGSRSNHAVTRER